jgi:hypothetical protein
MKMTREPIKSYHISYNLFFIFIFKKLIFFSKRKKEKIGGGSGQGVAKNPTQGKAKRKKNSN